MSSKGHGDQQQQSTMNSAWHRMMEVQKIKTFYICTWRMLQSELVRSA